MKKLLPALCCLIILFSAQLNAQTIPGFYKDTIIAPGLRHPADFDWTPDGRYLVTQKGDNTFPAANAFIKIYSAAGTLIGNFYDLTDSVDSDFERGLLGIAVDPDFATNHYVYAYYNYRNPAQNNLAMRVVRFTEVANVGTAPTLILNIVYATSASTYPGNHFGGIIRFRPSEPTKLYIQTGDLAYNQTTPSLNYANKLTNPYGKILRINTDGTIPTDNPYYDDGNPATGNDDRIWSYGHRNMFGMCFSPVTDSMYSSENGLNAWDEFNIIHKGGFYGWANCEGMYNNSSTSVLCTATGDILPIEDWGSPLPALTGCLYYSGTTIASLNNHILVADNDYGRVYDMTMGNAPAYDIVTSRTTWFDNSPAGGGGGITAIKQGADGCVYFLRGGYTTLGYIFKVCPLGTGIAAQENIENMIGQNYPNPASGKTQIDYSVAQPSHVTISLYDITGRMIHTILNEQVNAGKHTAELSGLEKYSNGSYFYKIEVKQSEKVVYRQTKRMLIVN